MADPQQSTLSPSDVMSDPEFLSKDVGTKHQILLKVDPDGYGKMPRLSQDAVLSRLSKQTGQPQGRPVTPGPQSTGFRKGAEEEVGSTITAVPALIGEAAQHPVKTAVTMGKEFVAQPLRELAGEPQPGESREEYEKQFPADTQGFHRANLAGRLLNAGASTLGGNPQAAREAFARGDTSGAYAHLLTIPLLTAGVGGLLKTAKKPVEASRKEIASLQTISRGAVTGKGPADAAGRVAEMQRVVKQVLARRGIDDEQLKKLFPTAEKAGQRDLVGDVARGNQLILDVARDAVGFVHQPIDAVMNRLGPHPAGAVPTRISKSMRTVAQKAIDDGNNSLGGAINSLADNIEKKKSFGELNDVKQNANKMIDSLYSGVPGQAIDATAERAYAYKLAADTIRNEMYPELQRLSGSSIDLVKLGQREADAIALRDGIFEHYLKEVSPAQMSKEASTFMEYTLAGQGAPGHSYYSRHIVGRAAEKTGAVPTGGAEFNRKFRRGVGNIGKGMTQEKVESRGLTPPPGTEPANIRGTFTETQQPSPIQGQPPSVRTVKSGKYTATIQDKGTPTRVPAPKDKYTATVLQKGEREIPKLEMNPVADAAGDHTLKFSQGGKEIGWMQLPSADHLAKGAVETAWTELTPARGSGRGVEAYRQAIDFAKAQGKKWIYSDYLQSEGAKGVWARLEKEGFPVEQVQTAGGSRFRIDLSKVKKPGEVTITPYKPGTTQRFKRPVGKAIGVARGTGAAREVRRGMTPPPSEPEDKEPE